MDQETDARENLQDRTATRFTGKPARVSLRLNLLLWFLGISLVPLATVGWLGHRQALEGRRDDIALRLAASADTRIITLRRDLESRARLLEQQARARANEELLTDLAEACDASGVDPAHWVRSAAWRRMIEERGQGLGALTTIDGMADLYLVDARGRVLYSAQRGPLLGADLASDAGGATTLGRAWRRALGARGTGLTGPTFPFGDGPSARFYLAEPVRLASGEPAGMIAVAVSAASLLEQAHRQGVVGLSQRTLLLFEDHVLGVTDGSTTVVGARTGPVLEPEVLQRLHTGDRNVAFGRLGHGPSEPLLLRPAEYTDTSGRDVFAVLRHLRIQEQEIGIVTEIDRDAAMAGLKQARLWMFLLLAAISCLVVLAGILVSHRIAGPIARLGRAMQRVADGEHLLEVDLGGPAEVGRLARQFGFMLEAMREAQGASERQYRTQRSLFELHEKMRGESEPVALAETVLRYAADYYSAPVGVFYMAGSGGRLEPVARLGLGENDLTVKEVRIGEGVIGTVAAEGVCRLLTDLPAGHLQIETGVGRTTPASLIVAPFMQADEVKGLLEVGTLTPVNYTDLEFLVASCESVALALETARSRERVARLLGETRQQAGILARQQRELQVTNAHLARSDQYKSEFLANMSHELRTPLNSMLIMSQILAENSEGNLDADQVVAAETIHTAGRDLLLIIDDILDLSRVEAGKLEIHAEPIELKEILHNLEALFRPMADDLGLRFDVQPGGDLPDRFENDRGRVNQILNNLLGNALKFTEHGSVALRAYRPEPAELAGLPETSSGGWVAFAVSDTGIGMSGEQISRVFDAFNQGDGSIGRRFGGSGLGLSISRKLAELLGGRVTVQSRVGEGSTFTLYLPLALEEETGGTAAPYGPLEAPEPDAIDAAVEQLTEVASEVPGSERPAAPLPRSAPPRSIDRFVPTPPAQTSGPETGSTLESDEGPDRSAGVSLRGLTLLLCAARMRVMFRLAGELEACGARVLPARTWHEAKRALREGPDAALVAAATFGDDPAAVFESWSEVAGFETVPAFALIDSNDPEPDPRWNDHFGMPLDNASLRALGGSSGSCEAARIQEPEPGRAGT